MKVIVFLYVFFFACLLKVQASQPGPSKIQQQPKDCVKHPQIVKPNVIEKTTPKILVTDKFVKSSQIKTSTTIPHFSVFNFINLFYSKDTLDNIQVM